MKMRKHDNVEEKTSPMSGCREEDEKRVETSNRRAVW